MKNIHGSAQFRCKGFLCTIMATYQWKPWRKVCLLNEPGKRGRRGGLVCPIDVQVYCEGIPLDLKFILVFCLLFWYWDAGMNHKLSRFVCYSMRISSSQFHRPYFWIVKERHHSTYILNAYGSQMAAQYMYFRLKRLNAHYGLNSYIHKKATNRKRLLSDNRWIFDVFYFHGVDRLKNITNR